MTKAETVKLRRATLADVPFLTRAVIDAEHLPDSNRTMYEAIFGFTHEEAEEFIRSSLQREGSGHQLTFSTFHILEQDGVPVACCSAWIEGESGIPSGHAVGTLVSRALGTRRWRERTPAIRALAHAAPHRTPHALQLEAFHTVPAFRGRGLLGQLIAAVIALHRLERRGAWIAEIGLLQENEAAARAYTKAGFDVAWRTVEDTTAFHELTGSRGFIQLRRSVA